QGPGSLGVLRSDRAQGARGRRARRLPARRLPRARAPRARAPPARRPRRDDAARRRRLDELRHARGRDVSAVPPGGARSPAARDPARLAMAEVNAQMPRVRGLPEHGDNRIHLSEVDAWTRYDAPLLELPDDPPTPEELAIAERVIALVHEGATLQFGIGAVP